MNWKNGNLITNKPVQCYWIRYSEKEQKKFAFNILIETATLYALSGKSGNTALY
jgi:hypothetical protein